MSASSQAGEVTVHNALDAGGATVAILPPMPVGAG